MCVRERKPSPLQVEAASTMGKVFDSYLDNDTICLLLLSSMGMMSVLEHRDVVVIVRAADNNNCTGGGRQTMRQERVQKGQTAKEEVRGGDAANRYR